MKAKIKPAARLINTIGKDLIKDVPASVVELVKNAYDADAENVSIKFSKEKYKSEDYLSIIIKDDGHGMDYNTINNTWLVPATKNKISKRITDEKKRVVQGKKGIGRYAVAILGNQLKLTTVQNGEKTIVNINWDDFEKHDYLDEVEIDVETLKVNEPNGTTLEISGDKEYLDIWNNKEIEKIIKELRKLLSPFHKQEMNDFKIKISISNLFDEFNKYSNFESEIDPLPIVDMYNYRLHGKINSKGYAYLTYENNSDNDQTSFFQQEEIPSFHIALENDEKYCGEIELDFRVFDLDQPNIESLRHKLTNLVNIDFNRREITKQLKEITGVGIYRGGFRIRPYGDTSSDWLDLDISRVQNPSLRISSNQIIGFISIQSEELSNLEEKSARDGLRENAEFRGLKRQILRSLRHIETRRFEYRRSIDSSKKRNLDQKIQQLFDFTEFEDSLSKNFDQKIQQVKKGRDASEVKKEFFTEVNKNIKEIQKQREREYEEIKEIIALYQGQATLGNITSTVLHEGRKHTSWFSNTLPLVVEWLKDHKQNNDNFLLDKSINRLQSANNETKSLIDLFDKLDPLTISKNNKVSKIKIEELINYVEDVFKHAIEKENIKIIRNFNNNNPSIKGFSKDFKIIFTNLIENSIYWLSQDTNNNNKVIEFNVHQNENTLTIDVIDNGPGIKKEFIESEILFEPGFSAKVSGTGLGLAICGEAVKRNNGKLKSLYSTQGACFRIELGGNNDE